LTDEGASGIVSGNVTREEKGMTTASNTDDQNESRGSTRGGFLGRALGLGAGAAALGVAVDVAAPAIAEAAADSPAGWYDAKSHGLYGDGTHDDTSALNSLLATVVSDYPSGGGTIFFEPGVYLINGSATAHTNGGNYGAINIPFQQTGGSNAMITIELVGSVTPRGLMGDIPSADNPPSTSGAVLLRSNSDAGPSGSAYTFINCGTGNTSLIKLVMRNMTVRLPNQTNWKAIDATWACDLELQNVNVDVNADDQDIGEPNDFGSSHPSIGIQTPINGNGAKTTLTNCGVAGYTWGYWIQEHSEVDQCWVFRCLTGFALYTCDHDIRLGRLLIVSCPYCISANQPAADGPSGTYANVCEVWGGPIDIEDHPTGNGDPSWVAPVYHIDDGSNWLHGEITYSRVVANVGKVFGPLTVYGAAALAQRNVGWNVIPIANAVSSPSANAPGGGYLYADGGALKWRGGSGTVTTIASA
jgi:hypothetical protein